MTTATLNSIARDVPSATFSAVLARVLAALDRACASSADGVRGL